MFSGIEQHTIHPIPEHERRGRPRDQFSIWFSTNMTLLTVVTGALGPIACHISFLWTALAFLFGSLTGAIFIALHAVQGPALGVPQMIQSRGQFGAWGAIPVILMVVIMYVSFIASNCVVGGDALHNIVPAFSAHSAIIIMALLSFIPCIIGYRTIEAWSPLVSCLTMAVIALCFALCVINEIHSTHILKDFHGSFAGFLQAFSIAVLWQVATAPYVSDSSRYLPNDAKTYPHIFLACYGGTVCGTFLAMAVGAFLSAETGLTPALAISHIAGAWAGPIILILGLSIAFANAMDIYCCTLSFITLLHSFKPGWRPRGLSRIIISLLTILTATSMALFMSRSFSATYNALLEILMTVMIPWTAINLADFYLIKKGAYHVPSFFEKNGGLYGRLNIPAILSYLLGILAEIPFLKLSLYQGPLLPYCHDIDISWLIALGTATFSYLLLYKCSYLTKRSCHKSHR